jgi:hypothetical protein
MQKELYTKNIMPTKDYSQFQGCLFIYITVVFDLDSELQFRRTDGLFCRNENLSRKAGGGRSARAFFHIILRTWRPDAPSLIGESAFAGSGARPTACHRSGKLGPLGHAETQRGASYAGAEHGLGTRDVSFSSFIDLPLLAITELFSWQEAQFVKRPMQFRRIAVHPKRPCSTQLVLAISAAQQTDAQHPCAPRGQEIPDRVAHHVTILPLHRQPALASQEQIRFGFGPGHLPAFNNGGLRTNTKSRQRGIYQGASTGGRYAESDSGPMQEAQQIHRSRQRPPKGQELLKDFSMTPLKRQYFCCAEVSAQFACDCPGEKAAAHTNPSMDEPAWNGHARFRECLLPSKNVGVDRIDERPVQIKDECAHGLFS